MENRARFPKMILEAVREGIGEDMILELRMSAEDGVDGGMDIRDMVGFCREIDGMADIIHVSNGLKWAGMLGSCRFHGCIMQCVSALHVKVAIAFSK